VDTTTETLIPLTKVPRYIHSPSPPHLSTVMRWVLRGVGNPPVKLATVKVGGRRYTTQVAIDAFISATSSQTPASGTSAVRDRAHEAAVRRAEHELDADGVC
jgi:hypothetical protein